MVWYEVIFKLLLSIVVGGLIGYERESNNRPAGFRTHILVCMGAAIISMVEIYNLQKASSIIAREPAMSNVLKTEIGRLGAQVITGVGFLGAGTIMRDKGSVKGLTTAATVWIVACIGLAIGHGYYFLSISSAAGVFIVLVTLKRVETRFFDKSKIIKLEIQYTSRRKLVERLEEYFSNHGIKIENIQFELEVDETTGHENCLYTVLVPRHMKASDIVKDLCYYDEIMKVSLV